MSKTDIAQTAKRPPGSLLYVGIKQAAKSIQLPIRPFLMEKEAYLKR